MRKFILWGSESGIFVEHVQFIVHNVIYLNIWKVSESILSKYHLKILFHTVNARPMHFIGSGFKMNHHQYILLWKNIFYSLINQIELKGFSINFFVLSIFLFQAKLLQNSQAWLNATPSSSLNSMSGNFLPFLSLIKLFYSKS